MVKYQSLTIPGGVDKILLCYCVWWCLTRGSWWREWGCYFSIFVYILAAEKGAKNRGIRGGRVWVINMTQKNSVYLETLKIAPIPTRSGSKIQPSPGLWKWLHNQANFQFCQFFVVLHKIGHECIMTLHGRFTKITKKSKHGNVYNDRSTKK